MRYGQLAYLFKRAHTAIYWLSIMVDFALPESKETKLPLARELRSTGARMKSVPGISS